MDKSVITVNYEVTVVLNEAEARALDALFGYGVSQFLEAFYEKLGRAYLEPFEGGVRSLAVRVQKEIVPQLRAVSLARKAVTDALTTTCKECRADEGRHYSDCSRATKFSDSASATGTRVPVA